jgi:hypothetical protein
MDNKVRKSYRIREDICKEFESLVFLSNRGLKRGDAVISENGLVEDAMAMYLRCIKERARGKASLDAKCCDLLREE